MPPKTTKTTRKSRPEAAPALPPVEEALATLARRNLRAVIHLAVRLVATAILLVLLEAQFPGLRRGPGRLVLEAGGGALVLWPFFTALGRAAAWRIALGRSYARAGRWSAAEQTLLPFTRAAYQPFDAAGEGTYWLATTRRALGHEDEARRLLEAVARSRRGEWQARAAAELAAHG